MVIDTDVILANAAETFKNGVHAFQNIGLGDVGMGLIAIGVALAANQLWRSWKKKKGYRMAVRERTTKETELLGQIINDGLFEAECAGKISSQRVRALYNDISKKLDLPDLVPKQYRLPMVKEELKRKRIREGKLDPKTMNKTIFSEKIGGFATKFWPKKAG